MNQPAMLGCAWLTSRSSTLAAARIQLFKFGDQSRGKRPDKETGEFTVFHLAAKHQSGEIGRFGFVGRPARLYHVHIKLTDYHYERGSGRFHREEFAVGVGLLLSE